ncbi:MAG: MBL fold metallo-hydrolase [Desulfurococcaceae archaeon]|uniref:MBL fold metallo-hydrolase n=1 Tax=Staphylothermus marinus TaxID=2280 RepID=A0A7C4JL97_STAMA
MIYLKILGGGLEVGRVGLEIIDRNKAILLDYGINFDEEDRPQYPLHVKPSELSSIVISHAHLDHVGAAPSLYVTGETPLYTTEPTLEISKILINDFLKISGYYADYDIIEVNNMVRNTRVIDYGVETEVEGFTIILTNANHILGSSMIYLETPSGYRILYTGDFNNIETKTLPPLEFSFRDIDILIIETTYGSKKHPPRKLVEKEFVNDIEEVVESGGTVLIPAFSVGRTQEVLAIIYENAPHLDVYVDGMSKDITTLYLKYLHLLKNPSLFRKIVENTYFVRGWEDRRKIWKRECVIVASAGMLNGGPSLYYLKKIYENEKNAVFIVSYQSPNSYGHKILESGSLDEIGLGRVKARVKWFDLSSHAGRDGLLEIVSRFKNSLKHVIAIHGEPDSAHFFANSVKTSIDKDLEIHVPSNGEVLELT